MTTLDAQAFRGLCLQPSTLDPEVFGRIVEDKLGLQLYWRPPFDDAQFIFQMCLEPTRDFTRTDCVFSAFGNLVLVRLPQPYSDIEEEFKRLLVLSGWTVVPEEMLEWKVFPNPDSTVYDAFFDYS